MPSTRSLSRNYIYNLMLTAMNAVFPLLVFPYVSRIIGPEGIGRVNFAASVASYFAMFAAIGIPIYGIKEIARVRRDPEALSRTFSELFAMTLVSSGVATVLYGIAMWNVPRFREDWPVFLVSGSTIALSVFSLDWFYAGMEDYRYIAVRGAVVKVISVVLVFLLVRAPPDVLPYAAIGVVAAAGSSVLNYLNSRRYVRLSFRDLDMRRHLGPAAFLFGAVILTSFYNTFDSVLLGFMKGARSVGLYSIDRKVTGVFLTIVGGLGTVLVPRLSYYVKHRLDREYNEAAEMSISFVYFLSLPAIVLLEMYSPEILRLFGGVPFQEASLSLRLIAPQILLASMAAFIASQVLLAHNEEGKIVLATLVGAVAGPAVNFLFIPRFDYNAAAVSVVAAEGSIVAALLVLSRRYLTFRMAGRQNLQYVWAAMIMVIVCLTANQLSLPWFWRLTLGSSVALLAYVAFLYAIGDRMLRQILSRYVIRPGSSVNLESAEVGALHKSVIEE